MRDHSVDKPLQHGRMYIVGSLRAVEGEAEQERHAKCFLAKHPDAAIVAPGKDIHSSAWYTLEPESVYYFGMFSSPTMFHQRPPFADRRSFPSGGFGSVKYIGFLPIDLYAASGNGTQTAESVSEQPPRRAVVWQS